MYVCCVAAVVSGDELLLELAEISECDFLWKLAHKESFVFVIECLLSVLLLNSLNGRATNLLAKLDVDEDADADADTDAASEL